MVRAIVLASIGIACSLATICAPPCDAKPRSVQVDAAFDECLWAAEVEIVSVDENVHVRVTESADAVFRGHTLLGRMVEAQPCGGGPTSCTTELLPLVQSRARVLMVVGRDNRVALIGHAKEIDGESGYHLHTWCDYNAVWFYSKDKAFGKAVGDTFDGVYAVTTKQIAARFSDERKALIAALAKVLVRPSMELPDRDIKPVIAQLGHEQFYVREAAQRRLASLPENAVTMLQDEARRATDPEISNRLLAAVKAIQTPLHRHAHQIRAQGTQQEARILLAALQTASEEDRPAIIYRLQAMAETHWPDREFASIEELLTAWRSQAK